MYVSFEYVVSTYIHDQHPKAFRGGPSLVALISEHFRHLGWYHLHGAVLRAISCSVGEIKAHTKVG